MNGQKRLLNLLQSHGWLLLRTRRHWKLIPPYPDGMIVVMSLTASDHRALDNMISDVRRMYRKIGRESPL